MVKFLKCVDKGYQSKVFLKTQVLFSNELFFLFYLKLTVFCKISIFTCQII